MARPGLTRHRKFLRLARALGNVPLALGCLELIWEKCYESGDPYLGDSVDVELAAQWPGDRGALFNALLTAGGDGNVGFIEEIEGRPGHFRCHDLFDHAPEYVADRRKRELARQAKGVTLSQIRADAGRKGAAATNSKRTANDGKQSANDRQLACTPAPAPAPQPNQNPSSEQQNCSDQENEKTPSREANKLAELLKTEILRNKPDYRITQGQLRKWAQTADRMLRLDRRSEDQVAALIRWAQRDEFWMANVLSMDTLREKFDQLDLKRASGLRAERSCAALPKPAARSMPNPANEKRERLREAGFNI